MSDSDDPHSRYDEARRSFDDLGVEEQTRFLVEATASTVAHGLLQAGEALADSLEEVVRRARQRRNPSGRPNGPGPAEPETAQRQAPDAGSN